MPASMVKTKQDEKDWNRAKKLVEDQYGSTEDRWAIVTHIFKNIQKSHEKAALVERVVDRHLISSRILEKWWSSL